MIQRILLFRLRPELTEDDVRALLTILGAARSRIQGLERLHLGRRIEESAGYEIASGVAGVDAARQCDFDYAITFEFATREDLQRYLESPVQIQLRHRFAQAVEAAVVADYEV